MRRAVLITMALIAAAATAACGDPEVATDESPAPVTTVAQGEPTEPADVTGDLGEAVRAYVDALAAFDHPSDMRDALKHTEDGSTAYVYLAHRANLADAFLDGGFPMPEFQVTEVGDGFEVCPIDDPDGCGTFTGFEATADGKLTNLRVDGEVVSSLLTTGTGDTVSAGGVTAEFLTAYNNVEGLWVTARLTAGSGPMNVDAFAAAYRAPDGAQRQATDSYGPNELGADSTATVAMVFGDVEAGGTVSLSVWDQDFFNETVLELQVG